jgi:DtxR family Mn-dependent transcriptional regulator
MPSESVENYLKAIYMIERRAVGAGRVKNKAIAESLALALPSVTSMLKSLAARGLLDYVPYRGVQLTEEGRSAALKVIRRHRLVELFLHETLELTWSEVHEEAERLEHALSDKLTDRMDTFLGYPTIDPHGDPIPTREGVMPATEGRSLLGVGVGATAVVTRVLTQDSAFLEYLAQKGIVLNTRVLIQEVAPFEGPITLAVGPLLATVALSRDASRLLFVKVEEPPV